MDRGSTPTEWIRPTAGTPTSPARTSARLTTAASVVPSGSADDGESTWNQATVRPPRSTSAASAAPGRPAPSGVAGDAAGGTAAANAVIGSRLEHQGDVVAA